MADPALPPPRDFPSKRISPPPLRHKHSDLSEEDEFMASATGCGRDDAAAARHRRRSREKPVAPEVQARTASPLHIRTSAGLDDEDTDLLADSPTADLSLPLLSPSSAASLASRSPDRVYFRHQPKSLSGIALRAFCLGLAFAAGALGTVLTVTVTPLWRLFFFFATLALFHFLEFWTTAAYNTRNADVSSFLLTANWPAYAIAHALATLECLVSNVFWPHRAWAPLGAAPLLCLAGVMLVAVGQTVRSVAMWQAGTSFNHMVQHHRSAEHDLVTTGIYARLRHPSYFGFFWWALGTQLVMGNAVCFFLYAGALWRFFSSRVRDEEVSLVRFFGADYVAYRKRVGTKIPFVP